MTDTSRQGNFYGQSLTIAVADGRLAIFIGVQTLAQAVCHAPWANPWRENEAEYGGGNYVRDFVILDVHEFAKDVARAMLTEREDGSSPLSDFLDAMSKAAIEDGSVACDEAPAEGIPHGQHAPTETWAESR